MAAADQRKFAPTLEWQADSAEYLKGCFGADHFDRISAALATPPLETVFRVNTLKFTTEEVLADLRSLMLSDIMAGRAGEPRLHPSIPYAIVLPGSGPHRIDYSEARDPSSGVIKELAVNRICGEAVLRGADVYVPGLLGSSKGVEEGDLVAVSIVREAPGDTWCKMPRGCILNSPTDPAMTQEEGAGSARAAEAGAATGSEPGASGAGGNVHPASRTHMHIGLGRAMMSRVRLFKEASGLAIRMERRVYSLPSMTGRRAGQGMLQNLPSIVAAAVLGPAPGSRVLDMCASPGGKTTALAQIMLNQGEIVAFDRSHSKVLEVMELCSEMGAGIVKAYKMDACWACLKEPQRGEKRQRVEGEEEGKGQEGLEGAGRPATEGEEPQGAPGPGPGSAPPAKAKVLNPKDEARQERRRLAALKRGMPDPTVVEASRAATTEGFPPESFDHVLLDAPCSSLGLRPRLTQTATLKQLETSAAYQRNLIDTAVRLLKPGGTMVFSTCTISPMENESNTRYLLDKYGGAMRLMPQSPYLGGPGLVGQHPRVSDTSPGGAFDTWLTEDEARLVQRFDPAAGQTIGFYVAKFEKFASLPASGGGSVTNGPNGAAT